MDRDSLDTDPRTESPRQRPPGQRPPWTETPREHRFPLDRDPQTETPWTEMPCRVRTRGFLKSNMVTRDNPQRKIDTFLDVVVEKEIFNTACGFVSVQCDEWQKISTQRQ